MFCKHNWNKPEIIEYDTAIHITDYITDNSRQGHDEIIVGKSTLYTCKKCSKIKRIDL